MATPTSGSATGAPEMIWRSGSADVAEPCVPAVQIGDLSWLDRLTLAFPRHLAGFTFPDWLRMLRRQRWQVDAIFLPRAAVATLGTVVTSLLKPFDDACRMDRRDDAAWRRPTFILGAPRSGTTYLFNLLARDGRFAFATQVEVFHPHTFLTLRRLGLHRVLGVLPTRSRAMDAVRVGWLSPAEDSIALTILGVRGDGSRSIFPRTESGEEISADRFRTALATFTRKLVHAHRRPLLLKSPGHTSRIPDILAVFPEARFVTIHRNPETVLASAIGTLRSAARVWNALQWPPARRLDDMIDSLGGMLDAYFDARPLIPPANLIEVRFEDLVADEAGMLAAIYSGLGIGPSPSCQRAPGAAAVPYRRNTHPPLHEAVRDRLRSTCRRLYEAGGYVTGQDGRP